MGTGLDAKAVFYAVRFWACFFLCLFLVRLSWAQDGSRRELPAVKFDVPPKIDGDITDDVWKKVDPVTEFWDNQQGQKVTEQTHVRIGYDAKFIYVAFDVKDSKPDLVTAKETLEDSRFSNGSFGQGSLQEDLVDIRIDPFNTRSGNGSSIFSVNSIGTKSARLGGGRAKKTEWKGEWKAFVRRTPTGWTAEMQIPWQILNYPHKKVAQDFGINFFRYHHRLQLPSFWSNIGPNERPEFQGTWNGVRTPAPPTPKVSILPYVIGGLDDDKLTLKSGLDARIPLTSEMTAVGTFNPDFGTIEGAVESVGFSRTERFVADRRPFFLEGNGYFQAGMGFDIGQFFYARRVGKFDFGIKIYGKPTKDDSLGILNTISFGDRNDSVVNWRHQVSPHENYGVFANVKNSADDHANVLSANYYREWGKLALSSRYAKSDDNGESSLASSNTIWYQDKRNFFFLGYNDTNDKFRLPDGLLGFTGIKGWELFDELNFDWRTGAVRTNHTQFSYSHNDNLDGSPFQRGGSVGTFVGFRNGWGANLRASYYDFSGLIDRNLSLSLVKGYDNRFNNMGINVGGGTNASEGAGTISLSGAKRISKGFDVGFQAFLENFQGHTRQNVLTLSYELSPTQSFGGRMVTLNADTNWYLSYRNSGKKGTEWFVVLGDPNSKTFQRLLQLKMVFAI
jgi:hypothetical protein